MSHPFQESLKSVVIGIDPGRSGAIALLDTERWKLGVIDMPTITVRSNGKDLIEPSPHAIVELIKDVHPILICAERLFCNPGLPNADSIFKMGRWRGHFEMLTAALDIGFEDPDPSQWKRVMGLTSDKKLSRMRASALFPNVKHYWTREKDHDRAEAAMLALYGALSINLSPAKVIKPLTLLEG